MHLHLTNLLNLPGVVVESFSDSGDLICFRLGLLAQGIECPHCLCYTEELNQVRPIMVRDLPAFGKAVYLQLPRRQFYCRACQRYSTERIEFVDWRRRYTHRYEDSIDEQANSSTLEQISQEQRLSCEEVKSILTSASKRKKKTKKL